MYQKSDIQFRGLIYKNFITGSFTIIIMVCYIQSDSTGIKLTISTLSDCYEGWHYD